ncbi:MAG TPA: porin [Comamonas sp.]
MTFSLNKIVAAVGLITISTASVAADSSVNVYGRIDSSIASVKTGNDRVNAVNNGGSYFGFKGEEALGNGLKAGFILESGFESDTGSNSNTDSFFNNRSELFLSGNFGTVRMGRFLNPSYYAVADRVSLHNEDYGITYDQLYVYQGSDANRLAYTSPQMHGLTLESSVSLHERANGDASDKNAYDLAANYDRGNWSFGAGYGEHGDDKQYALRATWSQDAWTVSAYHQRAEEADSFTGAKAKINVTRAAVAYAIGAGEIHANFGHANAQGKSEANQWTVGYNHHLSKRTKIYAFYSQIQNKHGAAFGDELMANQDQKSVSAGIRHYF